MSPPSGTHRLGPDSAELLVKSYREGVAAKVGHDLVIVVGRWEATLELPEDPAAATVSLTADSRSLRPREGHGGVKSLTDKDRDEIGKNIDSKVLKGAPIAFRSTSVAAQGDGLAVAGELSIGGATRPVTASVEDRDGALHTTIPLVQSEYGITPYRGLMGALKVRDDVEIVLTANLKGSDPV